MGVLVGTSLVVIIPEGIEALYSAGSVTHTHEKSRSRSLDVRWHETDPQSLIRRTFPSSLDHIKNQQRRASSPKTLDSLSDFPTPKTVPTTTTAEPLAVPATDTPTAQPSDENSDATSEPRQHPTSSRSPHAFVGLSLILGFILMYLIDKVPQHASSSSRAQQRPHHISLENFAQGLHRVTSPTAEGDHDGMMLDPRPSIRHRRHLATTTGLVIHAAADGIALGASSSTTNTSLGLIIFMAIMIHKAPAAFGLTSVLLKQGFSKRQARAHLMIFSLASPMGALATWSLVKLAGRGRMGGEEGTQWWTGILLLFSAGTFLYVPLTDFLTLLLLSYLRQRRRLTYGRYVAMHTMQDEGSSASHDPSDSYMNGSSRTGRPAKGPRMQDTLAAVAGMLIPLLTQFGHRH